MASMFKQASEGLNQTLIDKRIEGQVKRISSKNKNASPDLFSNRFEARRITDNYIREKYKNLIVNRATANLVMKTLLSDPQTGLVSDFRNLIGGVGTGGREDFVDYLIKEFAVPKIDVINTSGVELRSGKVREGLAVNRDVYLVVTNGNIRARSFKTGRFVKLEPRYFEEI